jgi:hypothetical protein
MTLRKLSRLVSVSFHVTTLGWRAFAFHPAGDVRQLSMPSKVTMLHARRSTRIMPAC